MARGSAMECSALLDVCALDAHITEADAREGKQLLVRIVSMLSKMCARNANTHAHAHAQGDENVDGHGDGHGDEHDEEWKTRYLGLREHDCVGRFHPRNMRYCAELPEP